MAPSSLPHSPSPRTLQQAERGVLDRRYARKIFAKSLGVTAVGFVLPGLNFILAGRKKVGAAILSVYLILIATLAGFAYYVYSTNNLEIVTRIGADPKLLLLSMVVIGLVALLLFFNVVFGYLAAKPYRTSTGQKLVAVVVVSILGFCIAAPASISVYYLNITRNLLLDVFNEEPVQNNDAPIDDDDNNDDNNDNTVRPRPQSSPWNSGDRVNLMLLGSDAGDNRQGVRPDVIVVASIDTGTGETILLSLPRNLEKMPFPEGTPAAEEFPNGFRFEEDLLNSVWTWGDANPSLFPGSETPGLTATQQAVGASLGLDIDYYATVDMEGFSDTVDALGGVRVNVPRDLPIGKTGGPYSGYVEAGQDRLLDGYNALWYVRSRADSSDYDRMLRGRCMIDSLTQTATPIKIAQTFPALSQVIRNHVNTNIAASDLTAWSGLVSKVRSGGIEALTFTDEVINPANPDYELMQELVQDAINPVEETPSPAPTSTPTNTSSPAPTNSEEESGAEEEGASEEGTTTTATSEVC